MVSFFTMCRGEAQLLLDLLMIPCFSSSANSFLAASSLLLSNRLYLYWVALHDQEVLHAVRGLGQHLRPVEHTGEVLQHVLKRGAAAECLDCGK